jgi:superfamily I DNA/RNA helicase
VVGDVNQAVYGWRNADGSILFNMSSMKEAVTFRLAQSFRSGANITDLANQICYDKNSQIVSQNPLGEVIVRKFKSVEDEVRWVLSNVCKNSAIISRTNSYLEKFERACIENNICYLGKSFYRSNHINDLYQFFSDYTGTDTLAILDKAFINNASYSRHQSDDFKLVSSIIRKEGLSKFIDLVNTSRLLEDTGVTLTTGHSSKGLEWDRVFVIGCHTGHVPHKSANDDREERNLLYVMTSRAAKELIITCIDEPSIYLPSNVRKNAIES